MRKTMSQEPFDFSSTAESDFAPSHAYVSKKTKIEDVTSTAYTFTIVSVAVMRSVIIKKAAVSRS